MKQKRQHLVKPDYRFYVYKDRDGDSEVYGDLSSIPPIAAWLHQIHKKPAYVLNVWLKPGYSQ